MNRRTIIVDKWSDPRLTRIRDDAMIKLGPGAFLHIALQSTIIITSELPADSAAKLCGN